MSGFEIFIKEVSDKILGYIDSISNYGVNSNSFHTRIKLIRKTIDPDGYQP